MGAPITNQADQRTRSLSEACGSAAVMTTATVVALSKGVIVSVASAGIGIFTMGDGSTMALSLATGSQYLPIASTMYTASTGTITAYAMY